MFKQSVAKVLDNPLRQVLNKKEHSVRSAARELGISPAEMVYRLDAFDAKNEFAKRVRALPQRKPAAMRSSKSGKKKGSVK